MKKRRVLSIMMMQSLILASLAGCGGNAADGGAAEKPAAEEKARRHQRNRRAQRRQVRQRRVRILSENMRMDWRFTLRDR